MTLTMAPFWMEPRLSICPPPVWTVCPVITVWPSDAPTFALPFHQPTSLKLLGGVSVEFFTAIGTIGALTFNDEMTRRTGASSRPRSWKSDFLGAGASGYTSPPTVEPSSSTSTTRVMTRPVCSRRSNAEAVALRRVRLGSWTTFESLGCQGVPRSAAGHPEASVGSRATHTGERQQGRDARDDLVGVAAVAGQSGVDIGRDVATRRGRGGG